MPWWENVIGDTGHGEHAKNQARYNKHKAAHDREVAGTKPSTTLASRLSARRTKRRRKRNEPGLKP